MLLIASWKLFPSIATLLALGRLEDCLHYVTKQLEVVTSNPELYILRARLHDHFSNVSTAHYFFMDHIFVFCGYNI